MCRLCLKLRFCLVNDNGHMKYWGACWGAIKIPGDVLGSSVRLRGHPLTLPVTWAVLPTRLMYAIWDTGEQFLIELTPTNHCCMYVRTHARLSCLFGRMVFTIIPGEKKHAYKSWRAPMWTPNEIRTTNSFALHVSWRRRILHIKTGNQSTNTERINEPSIAYALYVSVDHRDEVQIRERGTGTTTWEQANRYMLRNKSSKINERD